MGPVPAYPLPLVGCILCPGLFFCCLGFAFLYQFLPFLDCHFCLLRTAFYSPHSLIAHKPGRLLGAVNPIAAARLILLLRTARLGGFPDFFGKLVPGKLQRPLPGQGTPRLFPLDRGFCLDRHRRLFLSYDLDKIHLLKYRKNASQLGTHFHSNLLNF